MRLIDADELMEHVWRDKLDSRELIAKMIDNAPTVKEISTKIPINVFERLISQDPKTGHWTYIRNSEVNGLKIVKCSKCGKRTYGSGNYCPNCGACMKDCRTLDEFIEDSKESEGV